MILAIEWLPEGIIICASLAVCLMWGFEALLTWLFPSKKKEEKDDG